jgi:DNA modification methylase
LGQLVVETWGIDRLRPYVSNPRKNDHAVERVAVAIKEYGFRVPIVARSTGEVVDGHLRLKAALSLGLKEVPVVLADDLTEAQIKGFRVSVNRMAELAEWDMTLLRAELIDLADLNFDLAMTGFDEAFLDDLLAEPDGEGEGLTDPDEAPPVPEHPVSRPGDLWILGPHRLICGSSTDPDTVARVLGGVAPNLMVTDPPYGVEYEPGLRDRADARKGKAKSNRATGQVLNDDKADWREAWALFPGQIAYVWHGMKAAGTVFGSLEAEKFEVRAEIVWVKTRPAIGWGRYSAQHESCFYAVRGKLERFKGASQPTVWKIDHSRSDTGHGTQKPVEAMRRPIEDSSSVGHAVYEPFSGSGTTLIACHQTKRSCHAVELNPAYVDVAVRRWQDFTGLEAVLDGSDGLTFAQIEAQRHEAQNDEP